MKGAAFFAGPVVGLVDVGCGGGGWQGPGDKCPRVMGRHPIDTDSIIGVQVGEVLVSRLEGEPYYMGEATSLLRRTAEQFGTADEWVLQYKDRTYPLKK